MMVAIEERLGKIITHHFADKNADEFERIIMNSNITAFGQKLKILTNLDGFDSKNIEMIRNMSNFRNWLAHNLIQSTGVIGYGLEDIEQKLEIMNSAGKLIEKDYQKEKEDFVKNAVTLSEYLDSNFPVSRLDI